ncbi:MAG: TauD/TfdA family dioxygenase [Blastocatellia bacterium]
MHITYSEAPLGAEITGLDLAQPLADTAFAQLEDLFHERGVLVFRDQELTDEQHLAFARRFGDLEIHVAKQYLKPDYPELLVISNIIEDGRPTGTQDAGQYWHTDLSYVAAPRSLFAALRPRSACAGWRRAWRNAVCQHNVCVRHVAGGN